MHDLIWAIVQYLMLSITHLLISKEPLEHNDFSVFSAHALKSPLVTSMSEKPASTYTHTPVLDSCVASKGSSPRQYFFCKKLKVYSDVQLLLDLSAN